MFRRRLSAVGRKETARPKILPCPQKKILPCPQKKILPCPQKKAHELAHRRALSSCVFSLLCPELRTRWSNFAPASAEPLARQDLVLPDTHVRNSTDFPLSSKPKHPSRNMREINTTAAGGNDESRWKSSRTLEPPTSRRRTPSTSPP